MNEMRKNNRVRIFCNAAIFCWVLIGLRFLFPLPSIIFNGVSEENIAELIRWIILCVMVVMGIGASLKLRLSMKISSALRLAVAISAYLVWTILFSHAVYEMLWLDILAGAPLKTTSIWWSANPWNVADVILFYVVVPMLLVIVLVGFLFNLRTESKGLGSN